jgi:hypothetical protein
MSEPQPRTKRVLREVHPANAIPFDDRLWPINVLLAILAGFEAGIIIATSDFATDDLLRNGWFRLGILGLIMLALVLGIFWLQGRMQRRMQLAVLASLLVHLWLSWGMQHWFLGLLRPQLKPPAVALDDTLAPPVTLPDYHWQDNQQHIRSDQTLQSVVSTETPDQQEEPLPTAQPAPAPAAPRAATNQLDQPPAQPEAATRPRAEPTAPRRDDRLSGQQLSRRESRRAEPDTAVSTVARTPQASDAPQPEAAVAAARQDSPAPSPPSQPSISDPLASPPEAQHASNPPLAAAARPAPSSPAPDAAASLARAARPSTVADAAPQLVDLPQQGTTAPAEPQPAQPAVAQASGGAPGMTRQRNFDLDLPGSGNPSQQPAAAARRSPTAATPAPIDQTAGTPAPVPRARATANAPSAALPSQVAVTADAPGSSQPEDLQATASSGVALPTASLPGNQRAPAGAAAIDLGQPRVESKLGQAASSGGGEPSAASGTPSSPLTRSSSATLAEGDEPGEVAAPVAASDAAPADSPGESAGTASAAHPANLPAAAGLADAPAVPLGGADFDAPDVGSGSVARRAANLGGREPGQGTGPEAAVERQLAAGTAAAGDEPELADVASPSDLAEGDVPGDSSRGLEAAGEAAASIRIAAALGVGGLDDTPSPEVGIPSRRARPESDVVHTAPNRLILERSGGRLPAEVRVQDVAVPGFRQRSRETRQELARQRGGSEGSEKAVEMGLDFLARHQNLDGSWSLHRFGGGPGYENAGYGQMQSDTAATGLALLAFLGAGYTHTDGKYRLHVARALDFLLANQQANGDLFLPMDPVSNRNVWLYSHGIAAIALCEAYGMTRDPLLREPAQQALAFIAEAQNPREGGWRYSPGRGSDTSVSGWQLMALKSGELAGLEVPPRCYELVQKWLDMAQSSGQPGLYVYRPASDIPHQREPSRVMTAEALLMRQYLGWKREHPDMLAGAAHLRANLPRWEGRGVRDAYYWYYATQVMFQMQGDYWVDWNNQLRSLLTSTQVSTGPLAGSWEPLGAVPDRWGREGGRIYVTCLHLLILEVYYRHLPLYQTLEEE